MEGYRISLMRRGLYRFGPLHLATRRLEVHEKTAWMLRSMLA